jgi:ubiquinone biosynthesis protein
LRAIHRRYQQANRTRQILTVLARYGFGELVTRVESEGVLGLGRRILQRRSPDRALARLTPGQRLARALEELGPTFIKLGQILSTRPDVLPHDYVTALAELQDNVPGFSFAEVSAVVKQELGSQPSELFLEFEPKPIAAASLSQVHRARLKTGEDVAVKVQRPGIEETIEADLGIMETLARLAERRFPQYAPQDSAGLVQEFGRALRRELDFVHEGQNCGICRANFRTDPSVVIPRVYPEFTRRRILTMELLKGTRISDTAVLAQAGFNRRELAVNGCAAYMKMIFEHGFFQADPHPGNVLVTPDGRIGIVDYGMFSRISPDDRHKLVDLLVAAYEQRADLIARLLLEASPSTEVSEDSLRSDIQNLLDRYYGVELQQVALGQVIRELLFLVRQHRLRVPANLNMLLRGLATVEGLGLLVDPEFNFMREMQPYVQKAGRERFGLPYLLHSLRQARGDFEILLHNLPDDLRKVLDRVKRGQLELVLNPEEFRKIGQGLERSNNRLAVAIVLAAIIVGSSLMVFAAPKGFMAFVPIVGILGFLIAAALGFWLLITVLRGGRFW